MVATAETRKAQQRAPPTPETSVRAIHHSLTQGYKSARIFSKGDSAMTQESKTTGRTFSAHETTSQLHDQFRHTVKGGFTEGPASNSL